MEQRLLEFREPRFWRFRPYVTSRLIEKIASTFREWFRRIGIRQHGWKLSFSHSAAVVQITINSVKFCLLLYLYESNWYRSFWCETLLGRIIVFVLPKCIRVLLKTSFCTFMLFEGIFYFIAEIW